MSGAEILAVMHYQTTGQADVAKWGWYEDDMSDSVRVMLEVCAHRPCPCPGDPSPPLRRSPLTTAALLACCPRRAQTREVPGVWSSGEPLKSTTVRRAARPSPPSIPAALRWKEADAPPPSPHGRHRAAASAARHSAPASMSASSRRVASQCTPPPSLPGVHSVPLLPACSRSWAQLLGTCASGRPTPHFRRVGHSQGVRQPHCLSVRGSPSAPPPRPQRGVTRSCPAPLRPLSYVSEGDVYSTWRERHIDQRGAQCVTPSNPPCPPPPPEPAS